MKALFDPAFGSQAHGATILVERSCYRRNRAQDPVATAGALALVFGSAAAFMLASPQFIHKKINEPTVVELMELPDDPPKEEPPEAQLDTPPPPPSQIMVPPPQITLPPVPTAIAATTVATPPSPPAPAAPAPAAPVARPAGPENGGDLSASLLEGKPPRYPMESRRGNEQGSVLLNLLLSADGRVAEISIARSSGFPRLDKAAMDAVRGWRWSPTLRDGAPVMVRGTYKIDFFLQGGGDRRRGGRREARGQDQGNGSPEGMTEH